MDNNERRAISYLKIFAIILTVSTILSFIPFGFAGSLVLSIVSFVLIFLAFKLLSASDQKFKLPFIFALIALIGLVIVVAGLLLLIGPALFSEGLTSASSALFTVGAAIFGIALTLIGLVLAVIGFIVGIILGLYRVGKKYDSSPISIGAIFLIIPVLDIVGLILVIVGLLKLPEK